MALQFNDKPIVCSLFSIYEGKWRTIINIIEIKVQIRESWVHYCKKRRVIISPFKKNGDLKFNHSLIFVLTCQFSRYIFPLNLVDGAVFVQKMYLFVFSIFLLLLMIMYNCLVWNQEKSIKMLMTTKKKEKFKFNTFRWNIQSLAI